MIARVLGSWSLALCTGCAAASGFQGVDARSGRNVVLTPGPKKPGQSFTGRYRSPQSGELTLVQYGDRLEGSYAYELCSCRFAGTVWGEVDGNRARVRFREAADCTPGHLLEGDGELFYRAIPLAEGPAQLFGSRRYLSERAGPRGAASYEHSVWTATEVDPRESPPGREAHCP